MKRFTAMLLVAACVLTLAACGTDKPEPESTEQTTPEQTEPVTEETTKETNFELTFKSSKNN